MAEQPKDPRRSRRWRALRDQVVAEEPICQLRLPGCTGISTTADHIKTFRTHPELALERSNLRGSCQPCNRARGSLPDEALLTGTAPRPRALDIFRQHSS